MCDCVYVHIGGVAWRHMGMGVRVRRGGVWSRSHQRRGVFRCNILIYSRSKGVVRQVEVEVEVERRQRQVEVEVEAEAKSERGRIPTTTKRR